MVPASDLRLLIVILLVRVLVARAGGFKGCNEDRRSQGSAK